MAGTTGVDFLCDVCMAPAIQPATPAALVRIPPGELQCGARRNTLAKHTMDPQHRQDVKSLLAAPPRVVNVGLELFAIDLASHSSSPSPQGGGEKQAQVVHVQWSPPAGGNAHLAGLLGKLRS
jgi:hypothetical protein